MLDHIVLSTNDYAYYRDFWPLAARAWRAFFPATTVTLAFLTARDLEDSLLEEMGKHGDVHVFRPVPGVPEFNQAKVIRHVLASRFPGEVCMVNDIDLIPLQRYFVESLMQRWKAGTLLLVGNKEFREVGSHKSMIGYMTAGGDVWRQLLNPEGLSYEDLVRSWVGLHMFDSQEDISINVGPPGAGYPGVPETSRRNRNFSDESLIHLLVHRWGGPVLHEPRGWPLREGTYAPKPGQREILSRSNWNLDIQKLRRGCYVQAHLPRPLDQDLVTPILSYLEELERG